MEMYEFWRGLWLLTTFSLSNYLASCDNEIDQEEKYVNQALDLKHAINAWIAFWNVDKDDWFK